MIPMRKARADRRGTTLIEVLVSFTLLVSVVSVSAPLIVRLGRLMTSARHYRMGLDEVSNQLERLSALNEDELRKAIKELAPSAFLAERFPDAKLRGSLDDADLGQRLTLRLSWRGMLEEREPIVMATWVSSRKHAPTGNE